MRETILTQLLAPTVRKARREFVLDQTPGLYALFLCVGASIPGMILPSEALLYIGKASGAGGLKSRCHFSGGTRNHSPRKSLAVLLEAELNLAPRPIQNSDGSFKTWALESPSEKILDEWMHSNLKIAYATAVGASSFEKGLIKRMAPPLNLTDCSQNEANLVVTNLRRRMDERMKQANGY